MSFTIARSIDDAVLALAEGARPIAGGSDLVVAARHGAHPLPEKLVAIDRIRELRTMTLNDAGLQIGAGVTHAELMKHAQIVEHYPALADAAALVGSPSTRNVGTLGGNIMNGSPAMDTGAPLVVLQAAVELQSQSGQRSLAISSLWAGPGRTTAEPNELCTSVMLPSVDQRSSSAYVRLEYRRAMEIAVVGAAAAIGLHPDGTIAWLNVALAAVAPTIMSIEIDVAGRLPEDSLGAVAEAASAQATPISDLRASDTYRRHTIGVMARRAVDAAARRANGEAIAVPVNRSLGIGALS